jgi:hypothetical protein
MSTKHILSGHKWHSRRAGLLAPAKACTSPLSVSWRTGGPSVMSSWMAVDGRAREGGGGRGRRGWRKEGRARHGDTRRRSPRGLSPQVVRGARGRRRWRCSRRGRARRAGRGGVAECEAEAVSGKRGGLLRVKPAALGVPPARLVPKDAGTVGSGLEWGVVAEGG